ncbi:hypothetical protein M413DRAFT_381438 [Hebeloma cylindrosporum]|uniref:Uncharacterized protein n=1 Tax=Hebeloma cylindrosporum TaxID=76867 RepID=A0A0C3CIL3_HEBCY|nr:hypothetical protein M413DRAFT_381438 [Hebeloma cylindrosporum h7]
MFSSIPTCAFVCNAVGPHQQYHPSWGMAQLASMAATVRSNSRLRERRSLSPPPLRIYESLSSAAEPEPAPPPPPVSWYGNVTGSNNHATTSDYSSNSNTNNSNNSNNNNNNNSSGSSMTMTTPLTATAAEANNNNTSRASGSPSLFGAWEPLGSSPEMLEAGFGNWSLQRIEQSGVSGSREAQEDEEDGEEDEEEVEEGEEMDEVEEAEEREEDEEMEDEDERQQRLRVDILSTASRLPRPEEFSATFSSSLSGAVGGGNQSQNQESNTNRLDHPYFPLPHPYYNTPEHSYPFLDTSLRRTTTTRSNSSRSYQSQRSMRPGSSNSLVTENAAEVRRRDDRAQAEELASGRSRGPPPARSPWPHLQGILTAEGENQLRESPWGLELLERIGATEEYRRSTSPPPDRPQPQRDVVPDDAVMILDEPEAERLQPTYWPTEPVPIIPRSPRPTTPILDFWSRPNYLSRYDGVTPTDPPPSLPPPDFGRSFDSEPQIPPSSNSDSHTPVPEGPHFAQFLRRLQVRRSGGPSTRPAPPSQLSPLSSPLLGVSNDRNNDRDGIDTPSAPLMPYRTWREEGHDAENEESIAHNTLAGLQRDLLSYTPLSHPSRPQVEPSPSSRPPVPASPLSSNEHFHPAWTSGSGNGAAGPGRTQRETTSSRHSLPQPPPAPSSSSFSLSSFAPGPFRNTVQQLVDARERDRLRGTAPSTSNSTSTYPSPAPASFATRLVDHRGRLAGVPSRGVPPPRMMYGQPPPLPPTIPPLYFGVGDDDDDDTGGRGAGGDADMDVVDTGFSPTSAAPTSRPSAAGNTAENMNTTRARRLSSYARGLGSAIPVSAISPEDSSNNIRERMSGRESFYGQRNVSHGSSSLSSYPTGTSSSEMHRYINAQARMAESRLRDSQPGSSETWSSSARPSTGTSATL